MSTKTISVKFEAYERLRAAKKGPNESFSQVILRARWPETTTTARALLKEVEGRGGVYSEGALNEIEEANQADAPPEDKWRGL